MKNLLIVIICAASIFGIGYYLDSNSLTSSFHLYKNSNEVSDQGIESTQIEMSVPQFKFLKLDGKYENIESYKGKIIILNFWASWCAPCVQEFPYIVKIVSKNPNIVLIAISSDFEAQEIQKFLNKLREGKHNIDSNQVVIAFDREREISSTYFNVLRLPETFIINKDFKIVKKVIGSDAWVSGETEKFIDTLL